MNNPDKTRYQVLSFAHHDEFVREVERLLAEGWKLQGGVSVSVSDRNPTREMLYSQALTIMEGGQP